MRNYNVIIQPIAQKDITDIGNYIAYTLCNPDAAIKLTNKFNEAFAQISNFPESGTPLTVNLPLLENYRFSIVENYIVFYTLDEKNETAYIMRVLYGGSDYANILTQ